MAAAPFAHSVPRAALRCSHSRVRRTAVVLLVAAAARTRASALAAMAGMVTNILIFFFKLMLKMHLMLWPGLLGCCLLVLGSTWSSISTC